MSSSQGANSDTISVATGSNEYAFSTVYVRNASDWIKYKKQTRIYSNYNPGSIGNKNTKPVWDKYGNNIRLDYLNGKLKCDDTCDGNAISGGIPEGIPLVIGSGLTYSA
jgi:hypothetical protein